MAESEETQSLSQTLTRIPMPSKVNFPADLLRKLVSGSGDNMAGKFEGNSKEVEGIELNLGLSLNGRFGVDPISNKLKRSSSIPEFINAIKDDGGNDDDDDEDGACLVSSCSTALSRTYSLPTATEEEVRKRKELQSLRRMEAKRKRYEKQKNAKNFKDGAANGKHLQEQCVKVFNEFSAMRMPSSTARSSFAFEINGKNGSPESKSSTSSSPESEPKPPPVIAGTSTTKTQNFSNIVVGRVKTENPTSKSGDKRNGSKEIARNMLEDMPCVSTKGHGPNGKRVEGFLYRYRKGEDVRIVCVCHGSFLTPAEFVKHAGGGDVAHPLKHIVVNPSFL